MNSRTGHVRAVFPVMGTTASVSVGTHRADIGPVLAAEAIDRISAVLAGIEDRFTLFRAGSELRRYRSGEVGRPSEQFLAVMAACAELQERTDGGFHPFDRDGLFDPTGFVKGWAAEQAVAAVRGMGVADACLAVGGDVRATGFAEPGRPWRVAVRSPVAVAEVVEVVQARSPGGPLAVATSGAYERGNHVWGPGTSPGAAGQRVSLGLGAVSVVGEDLGLADGLATALWALGSHSGPSAVWRALERWPGIEVIMVDPVGRVLLPPYASAR